MSGTNAIQELVCTQVVFHLACSSFNSMQTASALSLRHRGMILLMTDLPLHSTDSATVQQSWA